MPKYKIWRYNHEQWDANDIDPPTAVIDARNLDEAAERFSDQYNDGMDNIVAMVVQEDNGTYHMMETIKEWSVRTRVQATLTDLCAP